MRLLSSCVFFTLFFSLNAHAANSKPIATVVKIRGMVTKLPPSTLDAVVVQNGDQLIEDTSIVTGPKSFVRIKFIDNSEVMMGPDSKIILTEMDKTEVGIISLLKGRIRTEVQKAVKEEDQSKDKFYIRTRTAAMAVRGTDFQTIYNPDNHVTSLLTYKGSVAMAKMDETTHKRFEENTTTIVRDDITKVPEVQVVPGKPLSEKEELAKILTNKNTVLVPPGQNSFTSDALKRASLPVKISPVQLNALYKNNEFEEKNILNLKSGVEVKALKMELSTATQKSPAEGYYNSKTGEFAPRSGGFVDQNTGLYIAPDDSASFDTTTGVYMSEVSGDFDADTGQYFAPKGLILDSKQGFVVDQNSNVKPELLSLKEDLNKNIARDRIIGDLEGEMRIAEKSVNEKYIRNNLELSLNLGSEDLKNGSNEVKADGPWKFGVLWQVASANRFAPLLGLSFAKVGYKDDQAQDSKSLLSMLVGGKYSLTNRVELLAKLTLDQAHYANLNDTNPLNMFYEYRRIVVTKIHFGGIFEVMRSNRWSVNSELYGFIGFRKKFNDITVRSIKGYNFKIYPQYTIDEKRSVALGFFANHEGADVAGEKQSRNGRGAELKFNFNL